MKVLQEEEVFEKVKEILSQVAPDKANKGVTRNSSLANDLGLENEMLNIMMQVQNVFFGDNSKFDESKLSSPIVTVGDLCKLIVELSKD